MSQAALTKYLTAFGSLHRYRSAARGAAPHKPILLLAILHEIDAGRVRENLAPITPELAATFQAYWQALVSDAGSKPKMSYPFRYLQSEGFWELTKNGQTIALQTKYEPTLNQLAALCDGGRFADDLWPLLADAPTREILKRHLLATYFAGKSLELPEAATVDYLALQAERLKQQAQAKFRLHPPVKEAASDGYFVRNRLFPRVIKELYGYSCCVCDLSASLGNGSLIDGAHILDFATFHNDDPRNGLALCKNHHWGFDIGAWSLTDEATVLVSPKLRNDLVYVQNGKPIALPKDRAYRPDPEALRWHRERKFKAA